MTCTIKHENLMNKDEKCIISFDLSYLILKTTFSSFYWIIFDIKMITDYFIVFVTTVRASS